MPILDGFCFSFLFWGCQKSALIAILKTLLVASLLILGYDATASSNTHTHPFNGPLSTTTRMFSGLRSDPMALSHVLCRWVFLEVCLSQAFVGL